MIKNSQDSEQKYDEEKLDKLFSELEKLNEHTDQIVSKVEKSIAAGLGAGAAATFGLTIATISKTGTYPWIYFIILIVFLFGLWSALQKPLIEFNEERYKEIKKEIISVLGEPNKNSKKSKTSSIWESAFKSAEKVLETAPLACLQLGSIAGLIVLGARAEW